MATVESMAVPTTPEKNLPDFRLETKPPALDARQAMADEALAMWLRWNSVYEQVMAVMFDRRANLQELQNTLDLADEMRQNAVRLTQQLLGK